MSFDEDIGQPSDVRMLLSRLEVSTSQLAALSKVVGFITLLNFVSLTFSAIAFSFLRPFKGEPFAQMLLLVLTFAIASLVFLYFFDNKRKTGDILFQEISDELEWSPYQRNATNKFAITRPPGSSELPRAEVRIAIREYLLASTLPLADRESSVRIYLMLNMLCAVAGFVILVLSTNRA